jgi:hypothetical protein
MSSWTTASGLPIIMKTETATATQIYVKDSNKKIDENASSGSRVDTRGQTDGDEANRNFFNVLLRTRLKKVLTQSLLI